MDSALFAPTPDRAMVKSKRLPYLLQQPSEPMHENPESPTLKLQREGGRPLALQRPFSLAVCAKPLYSWLRFLLPLPHGGANSYS